MPWARPSTGCGRPSPCWTTCAPPGPRTRTSAPNFLDQALRHAQRHPDGADCPVCGAEGRPDLAWVEQAVDQLAALREEARSAQAARDGPEQASDELRYLVSRPPAEVPDELWVCVDAETARQVESAWNLLCLSCHYRPYDPGPTAEQLMVWHRDVRALVRQLSTCSPDT